MQSYSVCSKGVLLLSIVRVHWCWRAEGDGRLDVGVFTRASPEGDKDRPATKRTG